MALGGLLVVGVVALVLLDGSGKRELHPAGSRVVDFDIKSELVDGPRAAKVVIPPGGGATKRPLLVFLHGRNNDETSNLDDELFAELRALGRRAPVVAFPSADEASYWHDRESGAWGRYVLEEVIPQTERRFDTNGKVALAGMSMGGFGAYDLALRSGRRFCAVGGHSPAIWTSSGETAPGAFDDAEDFARHDLVSTARSDQARFARQPLWLDAGTEDPFDPGDRALVAALRAGGAALTVKRWPGGHERSYWRSHWKDYLRYYATALAACEN